MIASVLGLIAIPVYLDFATANDSLRSVFDVGALVPLFRVTAFGRALRRPGAVLRAVLRRRRGSRCGSTGPSASTARSPSSSRAPARCSAAAAVLIDPGRGRARRADLAARALAAVRLAAPRRPARSGSAGWSGCSCCGAALPAGAAGRRRCRSSCPASRTSRSCSVLVLLGDRASARRSSTCRRSTRCGRPATAVAILVKTGLLGGGDLARLRQPAALQAAARGGARAARARRARRRGCCARWSAARSSSSPAPCSPPRCSRASPRRRRRSRWRTRRSRRSGPAASRQTVNRGGLRAAGARLPEQGGRARLVRAADHQERPAACAART